MASMMTEIYQGLNQSQIESVLFGFIENALTEKYGPEPRELIVQRVSEEWHAIERTNTALDIAALQELTTWLRKNNYPFLMRGLAGSSLILFLLGITSGNPLPPHSYCPVCKTVWFEQAYKDGLDVPQGGLCVDDQISTLSDGHDIPWQTLWGFGDFCPVFEISLPSEIYPIVSDNIEKHWLNSFKYDFEFRYEQPIAQKCAQGLKIHNIDVVFDLPAAFEYPSGHELIGCAGEKDIILKSWKTMLEVPEKMLVGVPEGCHPQSVAELITLSGLLHSAYRDDEFSIKVFQLNNKIAFRDDIFLYLIRLGFIEKDAWRIMNALRKGQGLKFLTSMLKAEAEKWFIDWCGQVQYLPIKAETIEKMLFKLRMPDPKSL